METAANRQCHKDFATDVEDLSDGIKHYFRRQRPAGVMAYAAIASDKIKSSQVFTEPGQNRKNAEPNSSISEK